MNCTIFFFVFENIIRATFIPDFIKKQTQILKPVFINEKNIWYTNILVFIVGKINCGCSICE